MPVARGDNDQRRRGWLRRRNGSRRRARCGPVDEPDEGTDPDELRGPDSFPVGLRVEAPGKSDRVVRENIAQRGAGGLLRDPIRHPLIAARGDDH